MNTEKTNKILLAYLHDYNQAFFDSRKAIDTTINTISLPLVIVGWMLTLIYPSQFNYLWLNCISSFTLIISFFTAFFSHHTSEKSIINEIIKVTTAILDNEAYIPEQDKITNNLNKLSSICFSIGVISMLSFLILNISF